MALCVGGLVPSTVLELDTLSDIDAVAQPMLPEGVRRSSMFSVPCGAGLGTGIPH